MRSSLVWTALQLVLWLALSCSKAAAQQGLFLEQSFGDGHFVAAGEITGIRPASGGSAAATASFMRKDLSASQKARLVQLAAEDGLYTLKLKVGPPPNPKYFLTSVRASCLLTATSEKLLLNVDDDGQVVGVQLETSPSECPKFQAAAADSVYLAPEVDVAVDVPAVGPPVIYTGGADDLMRSKGKKPQQKQQQGQYRPPGQEAPAGEGQGPQAAPGEKKGIPKEEQTWWQRNWVYIAILFGLGLQVLKAQLEPQVQEMQRQQEAGQRRVAAPGGAPAAGASGAAGGTGRSQGAARRRG